MTTKSSEQALRFAMSDEAPWESLVNFLDQINSVEEFERLVPILKEGLRNEDLIVCYREWLTKWSDPQLPQVFHEACPILAARLNTPQKIRILLRGAEFRGVTPLLMGQVLEDIIKRHEVDGQQKVVYRRYRGNQWCDALRIVYHTQLQARTLTTLALPGHTTSGTCTGEGLFIDWRPQEERKLAGEFV